MLKFDFDHWCALARRDPAAFFRERERVIQEFIDAHPQQREQLRELQSQIDGMRAVAGTPAKSLQGLFGLLDDHLGALSGQLRELRTETARLQEIVGRLP